MIIEIIGLPGSGKTTLAERIKSEHQRKIYCIEGRSSVPKLKECKCLSSYRRWFTLKLTIIFSIFLSPLTCLIFFKYLFKVSKYSIQLEVSKSANWSFLVYLILLLNYQLVRYCLALGAASIFRRAVIIDEGFYYNSIRLQQFTHPNITHDLNKSYINSLWFVKIHIISIEIESDEALARFQKREANSDTQLYSRWYVDLSNNDWMELVWRKIELWIDELIEQQKARVIVLNKNLDFSDKTKLILDYINENK